MEIQGVVWRRSVNILVLYQQFDRNAVRETRYTNEEHILQQHSLNLSSHLLAITSEL